MTTNTYDGSETVHHSGAGQRVDDEYVGRRESTHASGVALGDCGLVRLQWGRPTGAEAGLDRHDQPCLGQTEHPVGDGASNIIQVVYTLEPMAFGNLISQSRGAADSFYLFNALGSTTQLTDSATIVTDSFLYDSFGNTISSSGWTTSSFKYIGRTGYYLDTDLPSLFLRARYYLPRTGMFLSRDLLASMPILRLALKVDTSMRTICRLF